MKMPADLLARLNADSRTSIALTFLFPKTAAKSCLRCTG
jgi:hypothetical protein